MDRNMLQDPKLQAMRKRLLRLLGKHILPTEMAVKEYGKQEIHVAADGRSYMVLPNGQWIRVLSKKESKK